MNNIAKIFTVAVTLVVGTGAISGMALANTNPLYPDRLKTPDVSLPSVGVGSVSRPPIGSAIKAMGSPRPTRLGA
jgi:hypothetical protein